MTAISERMLSGYLSALGHLVARQPGAGTAIFSTEDLPWVAEFEAATPEIAAEYDELRRRDRRFVRLEDFMGHSQGNEGDWDMYAFVLQTRWIAEAERECPRTAEALRCLPGLQSAFFSIAGTGFELPPHRGWNPGILRLHLGVRIGGRPGDVWIRVGDEVTYWTEGKAILFDDNLEHEVHNRSGTERVVLFCEILRPMPEPAGTVNRLAQRVAGLHPQSRAADRRFNELDAARR